MIVIDVGCARYGGDYSIERLIEEFHPDLLYGFDPNPATTQKPPGECDIYVIEDTVVFIERLAAWTYRGQIGYLEDGLNSCLTNREDVAKVECFDLADFILRRPEDAEIILKIDAEGSEYDLLKDMMVKGADQRLKLAWVEWHSPDRGRKLIEDHIACEIQEWRW